MNFTSNSQLTNENLRELVPSVFADKPWTAMSSKYQFIPTISIIEGMRKEGFSVVAARQSRTKIEGKGDFTKHILRFRRNIQELVVGDIFPEVVLINSHDGSSSYQLSSGLFRLACSNGMVCQMGQSHADYRTRHTGDIMGQVIEASYKIVEDFPAIIDRTQEWRGKSLTTAQQVAFAQSAALLRWDETQAQPAPESLLAVRRYADKPEEGNVWGTMNRVQESLIRGGNRYTQRDEQGYTTRRRTRPVTGIDQDVKLNKALWALTEKMASLL
jgi:hypothetical protein